MKTIAGFFKGIIKFAGVLIMFSLIAGLFFILYETVKIFGGSGGSSSGN